MNQKVLNRYPSMFLADSTSQAQNLRTGWQLYYFYYRHPSLKLAMARHSERVNGMFLDGHVEGAGERRLQELGIEALFGPDLARGYYE